jgi:hypothetical protein
MKYKIQVREQVRAFIDTLAPDSRIRFRIGRRGDCIPLKEILAGHHRLRTGG